MTVIPVVDWQAKAACLGKPLEWFFADGKGGGAALYDNARRLCWEVCPVREACLDECLEYELAIMLSPEHEGRFQRYGYRGGLTPKDRTELQSDLIALFGPPLKRCSECDQLFPADPLFQRTCSDACRRKRERERHAAWDRDRRPEKRAGRFTNAQHGTCTRAKTGCKCGPCKVWRAEARQRQRRNAKLRALEAAG
jgi:hypothetical protein